MSASELARCIEMAVHGTKSAYPSMLPADAFLKDLATMLRMLIGGAVTASGKPATAKQSRRKTGGRK